MRQWITAARWEDDKRFMLYIMRYRLRIVKNFFYKSSKYFCLGMEQEEARGQRD